jgi:AraC-like DNA-binding protein
LYRLVYFWYQIGMGGTPDQARETFFSSLRSATDIIRLLDWMPEIHFFAKNLDGQFMAVNRSSLQHHGLTSEAEIIGKTDYDFHPFSMASAYVEEDARVMNSGKVLAERRWLVYDHSGIQRWFLSTKHPLFGHDGEVIGVAGMMRPMAGSPFLAKGYSELETTVQYVLDHFAEKISVKKLAIRSGYSLSQFERKFRELFGMTPTYFITKARINAARARLGNGHDPIGTVAQECGFYDQSQFGRLFKRETGTTPREYRRFFQGRTGEK